MKFTLHTKIFFFSPEQMKIVGIDVGIKNLAICCLDFSDIQHTEIVQWHLLDVLGENKNATKTSIEECTNCMMDALQQIDWLNTLEETDKIAIEAQPAGRMATGNIKCKVLSHCIQSFFYLNTKATVTFVNPKTKIGQQVLKEFSGNTMEGGDENVKKRYQIHKKASIQIVKNIVQTTKWQEWFNRLKKKDDVADAYLLALVASRVKSKKRKRAT